MKTKLFTLFVALVCSAQMFAYDFVSGGIYYNIINTNEVAVAFGGDSYNSNYTGAIVIPDEVTYQGTVFPITAVADSAFYGAKITSIAFGKNVCRLGKGAFDSCGLLEEITLPDAITTIEDRTFFFCYSLQTVTLGSQLQHIGEGAFYDCVGLQAILMPNTVTELGRWAFYGCTNLKTANISTQVKAIRKSTFCYCSALESITIPEGVDTIGIYAFKGCKSLTSIVIPNSVQIIEDYAFEEDSALTAITIGEGVVNMGQDVFVSCPNLKTLTWNAIRHNKVYSNRWWYDSPTSFESITIGDKVEYIPSMLCYGMTNLTTLKMGSNVQEIDTYAFQNCKKITSISLPATLKIVGGNAFYGCEALKETHYAGDIASWCDITFTYAPEGNPMHITHNFFINGKQVKDLVIPEGVESIGAYAFYDCSTLTSVTLPSTLRYIGEQAFYGVDAFKPNEYGNAYYIGNGTNDYHILYQAKDITITSCTVHPNAKLISSAAFAGCTQLTEMTIPNSVTSIGASAFSGCTRLAKITLPTSLQSIGEKAFQQCEALTSITIPQGVEAIQQQTFSGCINLQEITIPATIKKIGGEYYGSSRNEYYEAFDVRPEGAKTYYLGTLEQWFDIDFCGGIGGGSLYINNAEIVDLVIPEGIDTIPQFAFDGNTGLRSIQLPNSVSVVSDYAFSYCIGLSSLSIPNGVREIGNYAFVYCDSVATISIGKGIESIGSGAFSTFKNPALTHIIIAAIQPPTMSGIVIPPLYKKITITVPCGLSDVYQQSDWRKFTNYQEAMLHNFIVRSNNETYGSVAVTQAPTCANDATAIFKATAKEGYAFTSWSDGNTENPRTVEVLDDITYIANFISTTGIENVTKNQASSVCKVIENGTIYILRNGERYMVDGRKVL